MTDELQHEHDISPVGKLAQHQRTGREVRVEWLDEWVDEYGEPHQVYVMSNGKRVSVAVFEMYWEWVE